MPGSKSAKLPNPKIRAQSLERAPEKSLKCLNPIGALEFDRSQSNYRPSPPMRASWMQFHKVQGSGFRVSLLGSGARGVRIHLRAEYGGLRLLDFKVLGLRLGV